MLHEGNIYLFDQVIRNLHSDGSVIEIGSYGGLSTNLICYLLRKYGKQNPFFTCDAWVYEGFQDAAGKKSEFIDGQNDITRASYMNYIRDSFIRSTTFLSSANLPFSVHASSDTFFTKWDSSEEVTDVFGRKVRLGGRICFAYIDGDHSLNAATRDFESVAKHLAGGGHILLDDSADDLLLGSAKLIQQIKSNPDFEIVCRNPNYLVRKKHHLHGPANRSH
jgi:hypothetical protein